ncbi:DUF6298 domain-containing protein [Hymenobacter sp. HD11105]
MLLLLFAPQASVAQSFTGIKEPALDFSYAGYGASEVELPQVPQVLFVRPSGADDTQLLQAALDHVAALPLQPNGFRGAVQLAGGQFRVAGQLRVTASGLVLRGATDPKSPTVLLATGISRRTLISIQPTVATQYGPPQAVSSQHVPVGSTQLQLAAVRDLKVGDRVLVRRSSTQPWIQSLGMDTIRGTFAELRLRWPVGSRDLVWSRRVSAVNSATQQVTLDAPLTTALEARYGGGTVSKVLEEHILQRVGLENLVLSSEFAPHNPKDEDHAWMALALDNVEDGWVSHVTMRHFVCSAVYVGPQARRITVADCRSEAPISEPGGYRRNTFWIEGQQVLVRNCQSESGMNDFAAGFCAGGPNVFLHCTATNALGPSGSFESWTSGVLYDDVTIRGAALRLTYDMRRAQAGGWTAANSVLWNCKATELVARGPVGAENLVQTASYSLFEEQLKRRLAGRTSRPAKSPESPAAPTSTQEFTAQTISAQPAATVISKPLTFAGGHFVTGGRGVWGGSVNDAWWLGQTSPANALDAGRSITRFVPGKTGPGLTEDLPALAQHLVQNGIPFYQSGPCLWYDRRRDEHSITRRTDGNVWAAFYEMPWVRSGQGQAWDGLSRYDLTRYNPWYFERTKEFAQLCDENGIVLYHNLYNTHNLLEIGAHWIDYPWRPANCINETGLPEPPPLEPRDRLHVANQFYDATNPQLRVLHRAYIFHVLNELAGYQNIVFGLGFQFSGPLVFQQFFQRTVAEWESQNKRPVRLVLATSKDITDAILADPALARQVAVIDMRYWQYRPDSTLWAPAGGQNLAFREMVGRDFRLSGDAAPPTTPQQAYRQVREYRERFPDKAVVAWHNGVGQLPAFMAGAAQVLTQNPTAGHGQGRVTDRTAFDAFVQTHLATVLPTLQPAATLATDSTWALATPSREVVMLYSQTGPTISLTQKLRKAPTTGLWFDPATGQTSAAELPKRWRKGAVLPKPTPAAWVLLLRR